MSKLKKFNLHHWLNNYKIRTRFPILKSSSGLLRLTTVLEVTVEDDDDTPANSTKISHSEAVEALNTSLQGDEEQNFEAHEILLYRRFRDHFKIKICSAEKNNGFFH